MDLIGQFSLCRVSGWKSNLINQGDMITCLATACCNLKSTHLRLCLRHNWSYSVPPSQCYPWHLFFSEGKIRWAGCDKRLSSQGYFHNQQALYQHLFCYLACSEVIACTNHLKTLCSSKKLQIISVLITAANVTVICSWSLAWCYSPQTFWSQSLNSFENDACPWSGSIRRGWERDRGCAHVFSQESRRMTWMSRVLFI